MAAAISVTMETKWPPQPTLHFHISLLTEEFSETCFQTKLIVSDYEAYLIVTGYPRKNTRILPFF